MFLSKRANVVYKVEHQPSSTESKSCIKENIVWTLVYCSSIGSSAVSVSLSHLYLVVASVGCLLLYRFPEDAPQEVESEESHTIDGFLTDETPVVCDESFDGDKYIPSGIGFEKQLFFSNRINIGCTEKGTWITALCPCVATDEEYMSLLVQSRWIIVGWNNGSIGLVDIYKGKVLGEFYSEQVQSAICCLAHQRKSSVFASGHVNGDIWLWSWQPCDSSLLSLNGPCEEVLCPFSVGNILFSTF